MSDGRFALAAPDGFKSAISGALKATQGLNLRTSGKAETSETEQADFRHPWEVRTPSCWTHPIGRSSLYRTATLHDARVPPGWRLPSACKLIPIDVDWSDRRSFER